LDETWEVRESMTKNYENITKTCWDYNDKKREIIKKKFDNVWNCFEQEIRKALPNQIIVYEMEK
jgi:hypothetical protein